MLTSLALENFKGVGARQHIEFAPLTLLFGANSAGKSTILQALLYLHELLERGSADVDRTELGGTVLELGGFARLVHRHELGRAIVLRAEFATPGGLERFGRDPGTIPFPDLDDDVESAWLEVNVSFTTTANFRGPLVRSAFIGIGSDPLVWLQTGASLREGEPLDVRINLAHEVLGEGADDIAASWATIAIPDAKTAPISTTAEGPANRPVGLEEWPGWNDRLLCPRFAVARSRLSALPTMDAPLRVIPFGDSEETHPQQIEQLRDEVRTFLEMAVLGTTGQLAQVLRDGLYIGPLRTIPPRGFLYERPGRITGWADGLAAWDLLLADRLSLVEETNDWLRRLNAGCQIVVQELFDRTASAEELSEGHVDKTARRLLLDTGAGSPVLPSEVGAGISQIMPVVVAALGGPMGIGLIEQPEIHVHPAVQVGLGDLLIQAALSRRAMVVETHSEHLILRVLRRIRETSEGAPWELHQPFSPDKLSVIYVEGGPEGVRIRRLRVDEQGEFLDRWPKGFFSERMEEL